MEKLDDKDYFGNSGAVIELKPKDFDSMKTYRLKSKRCTFVMFYAPWCGYCKRTKDVWIKLANSVAFADIAALNCEKNKGHVMKMNQDHPSKEFVKFYPTVVLYKNGEPVKVFKDERTYENLMNAVMECRRG